MKNKKRKEEKQKEKKIQFIINKYFNNLDINKSYHILIDNLWHTGKLQYIVGHLLNKKTINIKEVHVTIPIEKFYNILLSNGFILDEDCEIYKSNKLIDHKELTINYFDGHSVYYTYGIKKICRNTISFIKEFIK